MARQRQRRGDRDASDSLQQTAARRAGRSVEGGERQAKTLPAAIVARAPLSRNGSARRYRPAMHRLATARLDLRMFREDDLDAYADMCADEEVMRFIGVGGAVGADVAWRQMALFVGEWSLHGYGMWAVEERASGRLIGRVGFLNPHGWPAC